MNYLKITKSAKTDQGDKLRNRKIKKIRDSTEVHRKRIAILKQSLSLTRWIATLYAISIPESSSGIAMTLLLCITKKISYKFRIS